MNYSYNLRLDTHPFMIIPGNEPAIASVEEMSYTLNYSIA